MVKNEYLTVSDISKLYNVSKRNIRRIINKMVDLTNKNLLNKDHNGFWMVHRLLLKKFKPQRVRKPKYYALTIDPCVNYSEIDIDVIMKFIVDNVDDDGIEINYSVEQKKANNQNHIHCYIKSGKKKKIVELATLGFSGVSYKEAEIFDLEGWKNYITKDGSQIKTIKNER
jgi:transcriptional antiterminator